MRTYKNIQKDITTLRGKIGNIQKEVCGLQVDKDYKYLTLRQKDLRTLICIEEAICNKMYSTAAIIAQEAETSVREDVPVELFNFIVSTLSS